MAALDHREALLQVHGLAALATRARPLGLLAMAWSKRLCFPALQVKSNPRLKAKCPCQGFV